MAEPYLGELRIFSFEFPPRGWALSNGQLLPISQNQALFSLMGTTYGGDGRVNFGLPDLRSRVPVHFGNGISLGQRAGEENHTLNANETPTHTHLVSANSNTAGNVTTPVGNYFSNSAPPNIYGSGAGASLPSATITNFGGNQAHNNLQPFITLSFCVALQGTFPSQN
jgi:microcystin-dependent protein